MCQSQPLDQSEDFTGSVSGEHESSHRGCAPQSHSLVGDDVVARAEEIAGWEAAAISARNSDTPARSRVMTPFIVQQGQHLFMLAPESSEWVLAELRFDEANLVFTEVRKVRYAWPREAFGSLLSRVAVSGDVDTDLVKETSEEFSRWLGAQFHVNSGPST